MLTWILKAIDHNRYAVTAVIIAGVLTFTTLGCDPTVVSPLSGAKVTAQELTAEVEIAEIRLQTQLSGIEKEIETLTIKTGPAFEELARKKLAITKGLELVQATITEYGGPAAKPLTSLLGIAGLIFGGGVVADNKRKDGVIAKNKLP